MLNIIWRKKSWKTPTYTVFRQSSRIMAIWDGCQMNFTILIVLKHHSFIVLAAISSFRSRVTKCRWSRVWSLWPPLSHTVSRQNWPRHNWPPITGRTKTGPNKTGPNPKLAHTQNWPKQNWPIPKLAQTQNWAKPKTGPTQNWPSPKTGPKWIRRCTK